MTEISPTFKRRVEVEYLYFRPVRKGDDLFLLFERDDLKGLARFTKKSGLPSRIDRKNEEIDILKIGLSGIDKRCGYKNVQGFYRKSHSSNESRHIPNWE